MPPSNTQRRARGQALKPSDADNQLQELITASPADIPPDRQASLTRSPRRQFSPADAPPAAYNRQIRRTWAAIANQTLRRTGSFDAARRAGAAEVMAALDCDGIAQRIRHQKGALAGIPDAKAFTFPGDVKARSQGGGTSDRVIEQILAGATASAIVAGDA